MSSYNGVGYYGDTDSVGDPNSIGATQTYLNSSGSIGSLGLYAPLIDEYNRIFNYGDANYHTPEGYDIIGRFISQMGDQSSIDDLIVNFRAYCYILNNDLYNIPGVVASGSNQKSLSENIRLTKEWFDFRNDGNDGYRKEELIASAIPNQFRDQAPTKSYLSESTYQKMLDNFKTNIDPSNWYFPDSSGNPQLFTNFSVSDQNIILKNMLEGAFEDYQNKKVIDTTVTYFDFTTQQNVTKVDIALSAETTWKTYLTTFVSVNSSLLSPNTSLSFETFYDAFFNGVTGAQSFNDFFAKFIKDTYGDITSATSTAKLVIPSLVYNDFTEAVLNQYTITVNGGAAIGPSNSANGAPKTKILNNIFSLLVLLIESMQKVAATQSDRLQVLSKWQSAYTDLQTKIKFMTKGDNRFWTQVSGDDTLRTEFNNQNSAYTEMIKARASVVSDDSKSLQTQINQSSDQVNTQSDQATAILTELTSIFRSIFK